MTTDICRHQEIQFENWETFRRRLRYLHSILQTFEELQNRCFRLTYTPSVRIPIGYSSWPNRFHEWIARRYFRYQGGDYVRQ